MVTRAPNSPLETITDTIVREFAPRRIILFGSRARGDEHPESDFDLVVELEKDASAADASAIARSVQAALPNEVAHHCAVDVHVRMAGELEVRGDDPGWLDYDIVREGITIYTRPGALPTHRSSPRVAEPAPPPSRSADAWLEKARRDLAFIDHEAKHPEALWDLIAFHAQQAAEKSLKAALIIAGRRPTRTHDLTLLLAALDTAGADFSRLAEDCARLRPYAVAIRYPTDLGTPDRAEGEAVVAAARRIVTAAEEFRPAKVPLPIYLVE